MLIASFSTAAPLRTPELRLHPSQPSNTRPRLAPQTRSAGHPRPDLRVILVPQVADPPNLGVGGGEELRRLQIVARTPKRCHLGKQSLQIVETAPQSAAPAFHAERALPCTRRPRTDGSLPVVTYRAQPPGRPVGLPRDLVSSELVARMPLRSHVRPHGQEIVHPCYS